MNPVALAIIASLAWGIGNVLQKHGMVTSFPKITVREVFHQLGPIVKTLFTNWLWMLGLVFMIIGMFSFATALGAGDITLVQPLVCLTGVVATIIGVVFLKEKIGAMEWVGVTAILLGVMLVGSTGGGQSATLPGNDALLLFTGLTILLTIGALSLKKFGARTEFTLAVAAGMTFGLANLMGKVMTQRVILEVGAPFVFTRSEVWFTLLTDFPLIVVLICNFFGSVFNQTAFANGRASIVASLVVILSNVLPIVAALTIFGERVQVINGIGIAIVIAGTVILGLKKEEAEKDPSPASVVE